MGKPTKILLRMVQVVEVNLYESYCQIYGLLAIQVV